MRTACIHIPHLYVQMELLKNPSLRNRPLLIVALPEEGGCILDCSEELAQRGIEPPMPLRDARPLLGADTAMVTAQRREYHLLEENIISSIAGITLRIEPQGPATFFVDISRLPSMYKREDQLARALVLIIAETLHLKTKVGVGNSRLLAFEAALCARDEVLVIPPGAEKQFLAPLCIDCLPVARDVLERLHMLGIHTFGRLSAFSLSDLVSQFGPIGKLLWETANGIEEHDRIPCTFAVTDIDREIVCDGPVSSREQIATALSGLLYGLCEELKDLGKACRSIHLIFDLENKTFLERRFIFHRPTACREEMLRRIMAGIDRLELSSPIRIISVRASSLEPYEGDQRGLFRSRSGVSRRFANIGGFLRTKYGSPSLVRAVKNDNPSLLPDEQFIFVEP